MNLKVTTNQKPTIDMNIKKKERPIPNIILKTTIKSQKSKKKKGKKKQSKVQLETINKMSMSTTYLSIITLNVNGLNGPTKRHRGWGVPIMVQQK